MIDSKKIIDPPPEDVGVKVVWDEKRRAFVDAEKKRERITYTTINKLATMNLKPPDWLSEDLIAEGQTAIFAAKRKSGKSWGVLQFAVAVCTGESFLGHRCRKAGCIYVDTEGSKSRTKSRLLKQCGDRLDFLDNLIIIDKEDLKKYAKVNKDSMRIGNGLAEEITAIIKENPEMNIKLVIIDILEHVLPDRKKDESDYSFANRAINTLQAVGDDQDIENPAFLLVTHTRKSIIGTEDGDPFDEIIGSTGWIGATENAWTLRKQRKTGQIHFYTQGRDIVHEDDIVVELDRNTMKWIRVGDAEEIESQRFHQEYQNSVITKTIKKLLEQSSGEWSGTAQQIKEASSILFGSNGINDDVRKIGKFLSLHAEHFEFDSIHIEERRGNKYRKYVFTDVDRVITDLPEEQTEQEELDLM